MLQTAFEKFKNSLEVKNTVFTHINHILYKMAHVFDRDKRKKNLDYYSPYTALMAENPTISGINSLK